MGIVKFDISPCWCAWVDRYLMWMQVTLLEKRSNSVIIIHAYTYEDTNVSRHPFSLILLVQKHVTVSSDVEENNNKNITHIRQL